jgi:hypothetical protein
MSKSYTSNASYERGMRIRENKRLKKHQQGIADLKESFSKRKIKNLKKSIDKQKEN